MRWKIIGIIFTVFVVISVIGAALFFYFLFATPQPKPGTGDPGNVRLIEISNDPIFTILPPNSSLSGEIIQTPAEWKAPGFEHASWTGPSVRMNFTSNEPQEVIYSFIADRANATGWQVQAKDSDGQVFGWIKAYPDGANASLSLYGPHEGEYDLTVSAEAIYIAK